MKIQANDKGTVIIAARVTLSPETNANHAEALRQMEKIGTANYIRRALEELANQELTIGEAEDLRILADDPEIEAIANETRS